MSKKLMLGLGAIVILGGIFAFLALQPPSYSASQPFVTSVRFPSSINQGKFNYFTGSSFVQYNLASHSTAALIPPGILPDVSDIRWGSNATLFKATGYSGGDDLGAILTSKNLDLSASYWWVADFKTKKISLVGELKPGEEIYDASWQQGGTNYLYLKKTTGFITQLIQVTQAGTSHDLGTLSNTRDILWADDSSAITAKPQDNGLKTLQKVQLAHLTTQDLLSDVPGRPAVSPDGQNLAYIVYLNSDEGQPGTIEFFSTASSKPKQLVASFAGALSWSADSSTLAYFDGTDPKKSLLGLFDTTTQKTSTKTVSGKPAAASTLLFDDSGEKPVFYFGDHDDFLHELSASPTKNLPPIKDPASLLGADTVNQASYSIAYFPDSRRFSIIITGGPYSKTVQSVYGYFKAKGADPNQLNLRFVPGDNVDPAT